MTGHRIVNGNFEPVVLYYPGSQLLPEGFRGQPKTVESYLKYLTDHENHVVDRATLTTPDLHYATYGDTRTTMYNTLFFDTALENDAILAWTDSADDNFPVLCGREARKMSFHGWSPPGTGYRMSSPMSYIGAILQRLRWYGLDDAFARQSGQDSLRGMLEQYLTSFSLNADKMTMYGATSLLFAKLFCAHMDEVTKKLPPKTPLFTVHTNNNLHNISAYLSFYAFLKHAVPGRPNWIVNFDGHKDYGGTSRASARCAGATDNVLAPDKGTVENGPWGAFLPRFHENSGYVVLQTGAAQQSGAETVSYVSTSNANSTALKYTREAFLAKLRATVPSNSNVYITIDRDCMAGSCTGWGSGVISAVELRAFVGAAVQLLIEKQCQFVGFDIAGFPGNLNNLQEPQQCAVDYRSALNAQKDKDYPEQVERMQPKEDPWRMLVQDIGHCFGLMNGIPRASVARGEGDPRSRQLLASVPEDTTWPDAYALMCAARLYNTLPRKLYFTLPATGGAELHFYNPAKVKAVAPTPLETPLEEVGVLPHGRPRDLVTPSSIPSAEPPRDELAPPPPPMSGSDEAPPPLLRGGPPPAPARRPGLPQGGGGGLGGRLAVAAEFADKEPVYWGPINRGALEMWRQRLVAEKRLPEEVFEVSKALVDERIARDDVQALAVLYGSERYPLNIWDSDAWSTLLSWLAKDAHAGGA